MPNANSEASRQKWNERHSDREISGAACEVLQQHISLAPQKGSALDLACGLGRNALLLARHGLECDAVDISDIAISKLNDYANEHKLTITGRCADIESNGFGNKRYDVIVVSYFLYRPLFRAIEKALKPGGLLFYQTFVQTKATGSEVIDTGPSNSNYYLKENELRAQFKDLEIRYYQETRLQQNSKPVAMLVARKITDRNTN